jgi:serine/threonine protein kinase
VSERRRYELLGEVARALSVFHRHGIAVGDLSPKNLLFAHDQAASVYFVDCDAMRFQGRSVMPQLETPGWGVREVNPHEELATVASDSYKLGLLALRLLTGTQDTRDPGRLPRAVPSAMRYLIINALSAHPDKRPRPADWSGPLATAAATASTRTPVAVTATVPVATSTPMAPLGPPQGSPWNVPLQPAQPVPQTVKRQGSAQAPTRYGPRPNRAATTRNSNLLTGRLAWLIATVAGLVIPFVLLYNFYPTAFNTNYSTGSPFFFSVLYGLWNICVLFYGLYRTFRRRR